MALEQREGSGFNFFVGRDTDGHNSSNGRNEIYFDVSETRTGNRSRGHPCSHCYWFFAWDYGIDEADIAFNTSKFWNKHRRLQL
ncbi:MAG: hypothetical protein ACJ746_22080 [Bryobacteraceae bacterium]